MTWLKFIQVKISFPKRQLWLDFVSSHQKLYEMAIYFKQLSACSGDNNCAATSNEFYCVMGDPTLYSHCFNGARFVRRCRKSSFLLSFYSTSSNFYFSSPICLGSTTDHVPMALFFKGQPLPLQNTCRNCTS